MGRAKARFFHGIGFSKEQADELRQALLEVAATGKVEQIVETPYGTKYIVDGKLFTPLGKRMSIRTVWIVEKGKDQPRFVTAYTSRGE